MYNSAKFWEVDVLFYLLVERNPYFLGWRYFLIKQKVHAANLNRRSAIRQIFDKICRHLAEKIIIEKTRLIPLFRTSGDILSGFGSLCCISMVLRLTSSTTHTRSTMRHVIKSCGAPPHTLSLTSWIIAGCHSIICITWNIIECCGTYPHSALFPT